MSVPKHGLPDEMHDLVVKACDGDASAMAELFDHFRSRLRRMVEVRIDPRLNGRVDASTYYRKHFLTSSRELRTTRNMKTFRSFCGCD